MVNSADRQEDIARPQVAHAFRKPPLWAVKSSCDRARGRWLHSVAFVAPHCSKSHQIAVIFEGP